MEVREENDFHGHTSDFVEWEMDMECGAEAPLFRCATEWRGERSRGRRRRRGPRMGASRLVFRAPRRGAGKFGAEYRSPSGSGDRHASFSFSCRVDDEGFPAAPARGGHLLLPFLSGGRASGAATGYWPAAPARGGKQR